VAWLNAEDGERLLAGYAQLAAALGLAADAPKLGGRRASGAALARSRGLQALSLGRCGHPPTNALAVASKPRLTEPRQRH